MQNPERMTTDGVNIWVFYCEGPGPVGEGCPIFREDVAPTQNQAELDALRGRWEIVEGHWHCPRCVRRADDTLYGVETRLEPEEKRLLSHDNQRKPQGLSAITIENFKGIGQAVTIPLRPVTLLFGANSAGKSTIIQALQYAWEILENRNADVDRTRLGGEVIDLGGFQNLVHGHDLSRSITITLHYAGGLKDEAYLAPEFYDSEFVDLVDILGGQHADARDWLDVTQISVRLSSSWELGRGAYVSGYEVGLNGTWFGRISFDFSGPPELSVNFRHPYFQEDALRGYTEYGGKVMDDIRATFILEFLRHLPGNVADYDIKTESGLQSFWEALDAEIATDPDRVRYHVPAVIPEWGRHLTIKCSGGRSDDERISMGEEAGWVLSQLLLGAGESVLHELREMRYLGPLRAVPERTFSSPLKLDASRWANGLGAWDSLLRLPDAVEEGPTLIERCNHYLNEVLGLGYTVRRENRIQLPEDSAILSELRLFAAQYDERDGADLLRKVLEPLERLPRIAALQLYDEKREIDIEPMDIGVGVSQTLPVVVGAVEPNCTIFAVEQPELHIHPAVQSRMGDLFLRECLGTPGRVFLLETHSEHLMLRMLRRIRETADGELPPGYPPVTPEDVQVLYVENEGGVTSIVPLPITEDGDFAQKWPHGFFTEREEDLF